MARIVIFGAQGSAREIAWLAASTSFRGALLDPVAFVDGRNSPLLGKTQNGIPVLDVTEARRQFPDALAVLAVGSPALRQTLAQEAITAGFSFASIIHPNAIVSDTAQIGDGAVLYPQTVVATNVRLGNHVQMNMGATVSHDGVLEDFITLSPRVCICGHVQIKEGAFVGAGATVINGFADNKLILGKGSNIAAGACVVEDVADGALVKGVPARADKEQ